MVVKSRKQKLQQKQKYNYSKNLSRKGRRRMKGGAMQFAPGVAEDLKNKLTEFFINQKNFDKIRATLPMLVRRLMNSVDAEKGPGYGAAINEGIPKFINGITKTTIEGPVTKFEITPDLITPFNISNADL